MKFDLLFNSLLELGNFTQSDACDLRRELIAADVRSAGSLIQACFVLTARNATTASSGRLMHDHFKSEGSDEAKQQQ
jgi:hypothetical protein